MDYYEEAYNAMQTRTAIDPKLIEDASAPIPWLFDNIQLSSDEEGS